LRAAVGNALYAAVGDALFLRGRWRGQGLPQSPRGQWGTRQQEGYGKAEA
jgi:hypothetical protein